MTREEMKPLVEAFARSNRDGEPSIVRVFWFPDDKEVRVVEVDEMTVPSDAVMPFYLRADPDGNMPLPLAIALIRPEEVRTIRLPEGWGDWDDAVEIEGEPTNVLGR